MKTCNDIVIGIPALTSVPQEEGLDGEILYAPFVRQHPEYVLADSLRLTTKPSKEFFDFLLADEQPASIRAEKDVVNAKRQMRELFAKIIDFGRRKRLSKSE